MSTEIYYFTGTGNSLAVARDIAGNTGGKLIGIPSVVEKEEIQVSADILGIIFPAYCTRLPRIVERFVGKLTDIQSRYIFAVVTVGGISGHILDRLSEAISRQGGSLAAGFIVRMPANYIHNADALPLFLQNRMFRKWQRRAGEISEYVLKGRRGRLEKFNPIMTFLFSRTIEKKLELGELSPDADKNFRVDDTCNSCGICMRICPVGNIRMVDGTPKWQNHCEKCLACIQWCPEEAIQYGEATVKRKRYHHPGVKLADMLRRS